MWQLNAPYRRLRLHLENAAWHVDLHKINMRTRVAAATHATAAESAAGLLLRWAS
jgi:hypothetical protein